MTSAARCTRSARVAQLLGIRYDRAAMRLGQMLIRDGRITNSQLDQAIAMQPKRGGRIGTILFELGLIDADTLTVYLGLELGIPIATKAVLDRAKRAAVRLLTPDLAERFLCVPLVVQDRQLIAAVRDPHDLLALDELGAATGCRIIPRVAPEVRLYYYVERYYGVPRPARFRAMGDAPVEVRRASADSVEPPPPPLPGLPPPPSRPVIAPPLPAPPLRLATEDDDLAVEMEADASDVAEVVEVPPKAAASAPTPAPAARPTPPPTPAEPAPAPTSTGTPVVPVAPADAVTMTWAVSPEGGTPPPAPPPVTLAETLARMDKASTRAEIAEAMLGYARGLFDVCAVLVVRDELGFGWKGFGPDLDPDRLETILVPLDATSIFKTAVEEKDLFVGPAPPSAIHGHLFKLLRTSAPAQAVVAPVMIRDRVVNLIYGHKHGEATLDETTLEGLREVSRQAAQAYARLIAHQKKHG
jgi:hypothetical protein